MEDEAHNQARADGDRIGDYRIVRTLGRRAFAITYEASDLRLGQAVVIKELFIRDRSVRDGDAVRHPDKVGDIPMAQLEAQFRAESRAMAAVSHPALVKFLNYFTEGGSEFLVTERVEGPTLQSYINRRTPPPDDRALRVMFAPVLDALDALHRAGLLHGNIKPSNIVIGPAGPVLTDLGAGRALATSAFGDAGLSFADLSYGAPEQLQPGLGGPGAWTDIFALAATIYAAVCGAPPITAPKRMAEVSAGRPDPYVSSDAYSRPGLGVLCAAIDLALRLDPRERPQTIGDFRDSLGWTAHDVQPPAEAPLADAPAAAPRDVAVLTRPLPVDMLRAQSGRRPMAAAGARPIPRDLLDMEDDGAVPATATFAPAPDWRETVRQDAAPEVYAGASSSGSREPDEPAPVGAARRSRPPLLKWALVAGVGMVALAITAQLFGKELAAGLAGVAKLLKLSAIGAAPGPATDVSDTVDVSVFAPPSAEPGDQFLVQVFLHAFDDDDETSAAAVAADPSAEKRGIATLEIDVPRGERLEVAVDAPGLTIDAPSQAIVWRGRARAVQFLLTVPLRHGGGPAQARVRILRASVPMAQVRFVVSVRERAPALPLQRAGQSAKRFTRAFLSYAHEDRVEVLKRAQALRAAKIEVFQDLLSLAPGEEWRDRLESEIDQCDLFLLFWSAAARRSEWVNREVDQAIAVRERSQSSTPEIMPVILEGPPPPAPPERLKHLHFDDGLCYVIAANPVDRARREREQPGLET